MLEDFEKRDDTEFLLRVRLPELRDGQREGARNTTVIEDVASRGGVMLDAGYGEASILRGDEEIAGSATYVQKRA